MTTTKWLIDAGHSQVQFKVKHLAIANVAGNFKTFEGSVESNNDDFDHAAVHFELAAESIDTNNAERDNHLKSDLFLNVEKFPKITFNGLLKKETGNYQLSGSLTILETTKNILFDVEYTGIGTGRFNDTRAGFEISGKINRKDFGLNFNLANEAGNLVVGNEIKLVGDIELIKQ
ncbi:YceI family protein [Chryseobacterium sp. NRRL B-14859]|uniref:YceI family protein n=1 Tax=unclassified Chryseobacterium TaxID=2593645 RepID=UPI000F457F55|nr:YceI family protein [Chryseobacterium sp. G0240]ROI04956.1 polyisoprenoid-binding protein [Chryseobacterium sp. G0240]